MTIKKEIRNDIACAIINNEEKVITDISSAIDLRRLFHSQHRLRR